MSGKTRILVVDDEPALCELIETVLTSAGMEVQAIAESAKAADVLEKEKFDAVFLDVRMPSPSGIELAQRMRASGFNQRTPVVMITGDADPSLLKRGFEAGANFFLFKPVDRRGLLRLVRASQGSIQHERRRFQRVPVACKVALEYKGQRLQGNTVDLSLNGMLVETNGALPTNARPDITLHLTVGSPLRTRGLVVRTTGQRMGVLLDAMGTLESSRLQDFLLPLILAAMEREKDQVN
jgi:DNA-binding response OmpR family regulator